ncbi:hypothetical protein SAMN04488059_101109 [Devosia psychrophila]|uniref:Uncharacterized protein n=1 Tax=Devosia psychrophila TaxID=728005 RepID=A0A1I1F263_9HYPH|nr:hypothetical protein SAMN04488059_101109 [Devosia psychrophila]
MCFQRGAGAPVALNDNGIGCIPHPSHPRCHPGLDPGPIPRFIHKPPDRGAHPGTSRPRPNIEDDIGVVGRKHTPTQPPPEKGEELIQFVAPSTDDRRPYSSPFPGGGEVGGILPQLNLSPPPMPSSIIPPSSGIRAALQRPVSGLTVGREKVALRPGLSGGDNRAGAKANAGVTICLPIKSRRPEAAFVSLLLLPTRRLPSRGPLVLLHRRSFDRPGTRVEYSPQPCLSLPISLVA